MTGCLVGVALCLFLCWGIARLLHGGVDRHARRVRDGRAMPLPDLRDRERVQ